MRWQIGLARPAHTWKGTAVPLPKPGSGGRIPRPETSLTWMCSADTANLLAPNRIAERQPPYKRSGWVTDRSSSRGIPAKSAALHV